MVPGALVKFLKNDLYCGIVASLSFPILVSQGLIIFSLGRLAHKMKDQRTQGLKPGGKGKGPFESPQGDPPVKPGPMRAALRHCHQSEDHPQPLLLGLH